METMTVTAVEVDTAVTLTGTTAAEFNTDENKAAFEAAVKSALTVCVCVCVFVWVCVCVCVCVCV